MKNLIKEFNRQTENTKGDETFIFAYHNPDTFRGTGVVSVGDEEQQARLLAGTVDGLSREAKELFMSYVVTDDPETFVATALSYIEQKQNEEK